MAQTEKYSIVNTEEIQQIELEKEKREKTNRTFKRVFS